MPEGSGTRGTGGLPYHFFHFTLPPSMASSPGMGFRSLEAKTYHSEHVKGMLKKIPLVSLLARPIAKLYTGTSVAVVARKTGRTSPRGDRASGD